MFPMENTDQGSIMLLSLLMGSRLEESTVMKMFTVSIGQYYQTTST